jgi:uncharacterized protein (DUF697 family)
MEEKEVVQEQEKVEKGMTPEAEGDKIIRNHALGSMGIGLIPLPLVDLVALTGVQLNMIRKLAGLYNIPFAKDKVKHAVASLVGSGIPVAIGGTLTSLIKTIPIIGQTTGALAMPAIAGGMTYALGKVFVQHFASGGTFLNFRPEEVKEYYAQMFQEGKKMADSFKKTVGAKKDDEDAA